MSHTFFIAVSYGVSLLGLGLLSGWMLLSYRREQRLLGELEARGVRRRSRTAEAGKTEAGKTEASGRPVVGVK